MPNTVEQIEEAILAFVRDSGHPRAVKTATPRQMGFDSLASIELVMALETALDIEIPDAWIGDEALLADKSFHDLAVLLHGRLNE